MSNKKTKENTTDSAKKYMVVASGGVYVRKEADVLSDSVALLEFGTEFEVIEVGVEWLRTEKGYVMNKPYIVSPV